MSGLACRTRTNTAAAVSLRRGNPSKREAAQSLHLDQTAAQPLREHGPPKRPPEASAEQRRAGDGRARLLLLLQVMTKILCAVDLTASARPVMAVAASLARSLRAKLELLHVVHLPPGLPAQYLSQDVIVDVKLGATDVMKARAAEMRDTGIDVQARVEVDLVDDGILARLRQTGAGVLVVGTHARQGAARLFLGSVAERMIRSAPCPVVVVPPSTAGRLASGEALAGPLKVVAGIDLSPASDAALAWLRTVDGQSRCDLRLVHLYWPPREHERLGLPPPPDPFAVEPEVVAVLTRELRSHVNANLGRADVPLRIRRFWAIEDDQLTGEAETDGADLLVVGTSQGRHSTALAAIRSAHLPVACVPYTRGDTAPRALAPVRTVLVATDLSPLGNAAVQEAYRLLLRGGGDVVLFHAAEPGPLELDPARRAELENRLLALVPHDVDVYGIRTRTSVVADRSAGEAIIKAVRRIGPDLVVMSSHGRSGLRRVARGSVAEHVTRAAPTPVLVVPASSDVPIASPEDEV
jgi:nucleotide-binding universal stress UspA family protein